MPRQDSTPVHMPREVQRRIVERAARNQVAVVVPRKGKPARVYDWESYSKMKQQPNKHKPWTYRKTQANPPEPLGAVDGDVHGPLSREKIYE